MEPKRHCLSCNGNADIDRLPMRERIAVDEFWRVAHAFDSALPGWLVLLPRRHVTTIAGLTDAEAASLGPWQVRLSRALGAVTGCAKTYVAQFAEAEGFAHVHFHIVPRWNGDHNFMTSVAAVKVIPQALEELHAELQKALRTVR